jgi:septal ring factor EnvC (AmiA/AmiB activator)
MLFGDPVEWEHARTLQDAVHSLKALLDLQTKEILSLRQELRSVEGEKARLIHRLNLSHRERVFLRETLKRIELTLEKALDSSNEKSRPEGHKTT